MFLTAARSSMFQSTLPAKGATIGEIIRLIFSRFQSTLPAKGATSITTFLIPNIVVSIHAPSEGSDGGLRRHGWLYACFNPRSQRRERPFPVLPVRRRTGFNPRSQRRERHRQTYDRQNIKGFQSTLPAKGATAKTNKFLLYFIYTFFCFTKFHSKKQS